MKRLSRLVAVAVIVFVLFGLVAAGAPPTPFDNIRVDHNASVGETLTSADVAVTDDVSVVDDANVGGDLAVTGAGTLGTLAVSGAGSIGGDLTLAAMLVQGDATITATNGVTITPAYGVYNLDSAGAVTVTLNACTAAGEGKMVFLAGDDANTITIADSNVRTTDGNALTIGQYDLVGLLCIDTEWIEMFKSANQ